MDVRELIYQLTRTDQWERETIVRIEDKDGRARAIKITYVKPWNEVPPAHVEIYGEFVN